MNKTTLNILSSSTLVFGSFGAVDSVPGSTREKMIGERTYYRPIANEFGIIYSDVLTFSYGMLKCNGTDFTDEEQRIIERWLTSPRQSRWLTVRDTEDPSYVTKYFGVFTNTEWSIGANGYILCSFTFQTDSPYPWVHGSHSFNIYASDTTSNISFIVDSDDLDSTIYPVITFSTYFDDTIRVTNKTDGNRSFKINISSAAPIIMDCRHNILKNGTTGTIINYSVLGWDDVSNIYWPQLHAGTNEWSISGGDLTLTIEYDAPFKRVGGWM